MNGLLVFSGLHSQEQNRKGGLQPRFRLFFRIELCLKKEGFVLTFSYAEWVRGIRKRSTELRWSFKRRFFVGKPESRS